MPKPARELTKGDEFIFHLHYAKYGRKAFQERFYPDMGETWVGAHARRLDVAIPGYEKEGWLDSSECADILGISRSAVMRRVRKAHKASGDTWEKDSKIVRFLGGKHPEAERYYKSLISEEWLQEELKKEEEIDKLREKARNWITSAEAAKLLGRDRKALVADLSAINRGVKFGINASGWYIQKYGQWWKPPGQNEGVLIEPRSWTIVCKYWKLRKLQMQKHRKTEAYRLHHVGPKPVIPTYMELKLVKDL